MVLPRMQWERLVWERYRALGEALQWGTKAQVLWNSRNLLSLVKEYSKS